MDAHESSQQLQRQGRLPEARNQLLICSDTSCPRLVRTDCLSWLSDVDKQIQSITIEARDANGKILMQVRGPMQSLPQAAPPTTPAVAAARPRGQPQDDGRPPRPSTRQTVVVSDDHSSAVTTPAVSTSPAPLPAKRRLTRAPEARPLAGISALGWTSGTLAAISFGAAAYFGANGISKAQQLRDTCAPDCKQSQVTSVRRQLLAADLSIIAGLGFGALTAWSIWESRRSDSAASAGEDSRDKGRNDGGLSATFDVGSAQVQYTGSF